MYAAEAYKPLSMKRQKTCSLWEFKERTDLQSFEDRLLDYDYIVLDTDRVDMKIVNRGDELIFQNRGKEILRTAKEHFLSDPSSTLNLFSESIDKYSFLRGFTYISLLTGFPIMLYLLAHAVFRSILSFLNYPTTALIIASLLCLLTGVALFIPVHKGRVTGNNIQDIEGSLRSERWQDKVTALRKIQEEKLEIADYQDYLDIVDSPHIPVRYWLARALGASEKSENYNVLLLLLDDPHPNVVCQALYGLRQRGDNRTADMIIQRMRGSLHWYVQSYAYSTMRNLGWKQTKSI
jgi:hypothetical protein